jgi:CRP-like cAMP-binding protein
MPSVERLKLRLIHTLRAKKFDAALAALILLECEEPDEPRWPRRAARLLHATSDTNGEIAALRRALELHVAQARTSEAIAVCRAILEVAPADRYALDTFERLQPASRSPNGSSRTSSSRSSSSSDDEGRRLPEKRVTARHASTGTSPGAATLRSELAMFPLFGALDPASLHSLVGKARVVSLEAGQVLFRQGDQANSLYIVVDGAVVPIAEGERRRKLAVLERGDFFGEIGLIAKQPRNATIEALVESKLLAIDHPVVCGLIAHQPAVAKDILRFLRRRLIDRQIRTHLFFSAFAHAEREAIARQFRVLEVEKGAALIQAGRPPEGLFVVLAGSMAVVGRDGDERGKELGALGMGDDLGGLALLEGRAARAAVIAKEKSWLVVLGEGRFRRILAAHPRLDRILRRIDLDSPARVDERSVVAL